MRTRTAGLNPYLRPVPSKTANPEYKCFLIFEGTNTEPTYFKALGKKQMKHNLVIVEKTDNEKGYSALTKLIELADDFQKALKINVPISRLTNGFHVPCNQMDCLNFQRKI